MLLQYIFVTYLSNKRCSYHLWLLVITKSGRKTTSNKFNRLQIEVVFFSTNISSPISPSPPPCLNIGPSNQIFQFPYTRSGRINKNLRYITGVRPHLRALIKEELKEPESANVIIML